MNDDEQIDVIVLRLCAERFDKKKIHKKNSEKM